MALIGFGKCSKFYFFIFSVVICEFICDCLTVLNKDNDDENTGQKNDNIINHNYKLNDHPLLQDLLKFLGSTFAGLILYIIYSKNEKNKEGELSIVEYEKKKVEYFGEKKVNKNYIVILIGILYASNIILRSFLISLKFDAGFWTLEILFLIYLSNRILKIKIGNHQKVTIFILAVVLFICQIISSFMQRTNHNCKSEIECEEYLYDNNLYYIIIGKFGHGIFIPIIFVVYIINFIMRDYSWVKTKYLMDIKTIPMYKILLLTGVIGTVLVIICFIFTTNLPCSSFEEVVQINNTFFYYDATHTTKTKIILSKQICSLIDYNEQTKKLTFYYDSFTMFLKEYHRFDGIGILEIFSLPIYLIMCLIISFSQIMMLKHLDAIILLVNVNFNYFIARLLSCIINSFSEEYLTIAIFILLEIEEIMSVLAYLIYMEIIELKFCKFDYDLKKNIIHRAETEYEFSLLDNEEQKE